MTVTYHLGDTREEVARNLFGTKPELPGQLDMFGGDA